MIPLKPLASFAQIAEQNGMATREFLGWLAEVCDRLPSGGTSTFGGGATTVAVTFAGVGLPNQPDTNYTITVEHPSKEPLWITSKTAAGFTLNTDVATGATVRWLVQR